MINPDILFGRLSNRMFLMAAWYAHSKKHNIPFFAQDEKYFEEYKDDIRKLYGADIQPNSTDRVAIHVRRAGNPINPKEPNYSDNPFYVDLGHHLHEDMTSEYMKDNYYAKAMALFPNEKFLVFSDDIEWCKSVELFKDCEFFHGTELEDMNKMASCKSQIIANSSFSWWAAWLGKWEGQKVIAPARWFSNPEDDQYIGIPKEWIRI